LAFGDNLGGIVAGLTIPEGFRATTIKSKKTTSFTRVRPAGYRIAVPILSGGAR
jgi:hypothetical protein